MHTRKMNVSTRLDYVLRIQDTILRSSVKPMWSFHENEEILDLIQWLKLVVELEVPTIEAAYLIWCKTDKRLEALQRFHVMTPQAISQDVIWFL